MISNEPVVTSATVVAFVTALLVLAVSFGLPVTEEQRAAIISVVAIVAPFGVIWWARRETTPLANPTVTTEDGSVTPLIRADTGRATPQAIAKGNFV